MWRVRNNIQHVSDVISGEQALTIYSNFRLPGFVFLLGRARGQAEGRRWCSCPAICLEASTKIFPMESLWSGQGLLRQRWCCAWGWWAMAVLTGLSQEMHRNSFYYRVFVPHIMGILSYHTLTLPQPYNYTIEFVGSTKESTRGLPNIPPEKKTP